MLPRLEGLSYCSRHPLGTPAAVSDLNRRNLFSKNFDLDLSTIFQHLKSQFGIHSYLF